MTATRIPSEVIKVPDFVTMTEPEPDKPMAELAVALVAMFTEDESLPQPRYLSISTTGQEITMQFGTRRTPSTSWPCGRTSSAAPSPAPAPKTCTANPLCAARSSSPTRVCR